MVSRAIVVSMKNPLAGPERAVRPSQGRIASRWVDWALLVVPGVIWGASFLFIAEGLAAVEPNGVTFTRIAIGFLTLSLFPTARRPVARADWAGTAALGVLWFAFPLSMFPFAEQHVSSALTGMLNGATPLCVAAVATLIARKLPERGTLAGLIIGFGGAVVMALPAMGGSSSAFGVALIVAALVSYGFALNVARPLQQRNGAIPVVWRALGVALILTAPLGLPAVLNGVWTLRPALAMLALGAGGTAIATILTATAAGRMGATKASATAFLIPVVALMLGVVIRHEQVTTLSLIGAAICLLGAAIIRDPKMFAALLPRRAVRVGARV
ncbi:MAG TPA: DMT family transporter [Vicinamibacterales bacterium]|nr:DMT family transporter [Vicinamibacterales bacterium]